MRVEVQHEDRIDAGGCQQREAPIHGGEQARGAIGAEKTLGVRIEGDGQGTQGQGSRLGDD